MTDQQYFENGSFQYEKSFKDKLLSFLAISGTVIFYILLTWGEIFGIYHAFTKHEDGYLALFMPPVAWYHSVEGIFWHNDFSGIDWNKQFSGDMGTIFAFINTMDSNDIEVIPKRQQAMVEFSTRINKYPMDKKNHLMKATLDYCSYYISGAKDMNDYMDSLSVGSKIQFGYSKITQSKWAKVMSYDEMKPYAENDEKLAKDQVSIYADSITMIPDRSDRKEFMHNYLQGVNDRLEALFIDLFGRLEWDNFKRDNPYTL